MKNKFLRLILLTVAVACMALFLSACDTEVDVSTELSLNDNLSGSRIMQTAGIKQSDLGGAATAVKVMESIRENAPDSMDVSYEEKGGKYYLTFTVSFTSLEDYEKKVESILGKDVSISYQRTDTAFGQSLNLEESFTTKELLIWIEDVLKKFDSKSSVDINYISTDLVLSSQTYSSSTAGRINVHSTDDNITFTSIDVATHVLGLDNYSRAITFRMSEDVFNTITEDALDAIVPADAVGQSLIDENAKASGRYIYQITYSGTGDTIASITSELFPGSTFECDNADTASDAFSVKCVIREAISFAHFPCNNDGTSNVSIVYSSGFDDESDTSSDTDNVVFSTDSAIAVGANADTDEVNDSSSVKISCTNAYSASVAIGVTFNYGIQNVTVDTVKNDDSLNVSVLFDYDINASDMALNVAKNYFSQQTESLKGVNVTTGATTRETESGKQKYYQLKISFTGSNDEVTAAMNTIAGSHNNFSDIYSDKFQLNTRHNISHRVDISKLLEYADYSGIVTYVFHSDSATIKGVDCQLFDGLTAVGEPDINMLNGKTKINSFTATVNGGCFRMSFQSTYVNIGFIIFVVIVAIIVIIVFTLLLSFVARKSKARKQVEAEIFRKATVERSLSLAVIQNTDGSIVPLSNQALANRPGAVVDSKRDDGLDEDDDEPETIWLFSTTLKLLSLIAAVLFFFPFVTVSCSNSSGTKSISAFSLMVGYEDMKPVTEVALLLVIPLIIFMLLFLWNKLPKFPSAIAIIVASAVSLLMLLNLEAIIDERIVAMMEYSNTAGNITAYSMEWAYSYSIIVYILLLIGAVVLLLAEISEKVKKKFK